MFVREKTVNGSTYLYLVESVREAARTKQRIIKNLGRKDAVLAGGGLDRLAASAARFAERALVLSAAERGDTAGLTCRRIGPPLLFGRLWEETGIKAVLDGLLAGRAFEFPVERAVFAAVLHRLMAPGSDRACERWLADYAIPGAEGLAPHHFYRAMAWGSARSWPHPGRPGRRRSPRARSRTWSRSGCSSAGATCSVT
jgi:hypothetical protein